MASLLIIMVDTVHLVLKSMGFSLFADTVRILMLLAFGTTYAIFHTVHV